jgi:hypothetical protein
MGEAAFADLPLDVGVAELLPPLGAVAGCGVAVGMCFFADAIARAFFGAGKTAVGWIPFAGDLVESSVDTIEQYVTGYIGEAESYYDAELGAATRNLADAGDKVLAQLAALGLLEDSIARRVGDWVAHTVQQDVVDRVVHESVVVVDHGIDYVGDATRVGDQALHGIDELLTGRVGSLEHAIEDVVEPDIATLRERTRAIEDELGRAWDEVKAHGEVIGAAGLASAVAVALETLGADWVRCRSAGLAGKALCGLGSGLLSDLLDGLLDIGALYELCSLVTLMTDAAAGSEVSGVLVTIVDGLEDLVRCRKLHGSGGLSEALYVQPGSLTSYGAPGVAA